MRILVVDDDKASIILLTKFLESYGTVDKAYNGEEAVTLFKQSVHEKQPYDIILLDIMMPIMNGHEALSEIRLIESSIQMGKKTKVIITSALSDSDNVIKAFHQECDAYITKPISLEKLNRELENLGILN